MLMESDAGGVPVLGYDSSPDKPLQVVNESEAELVRYIFVRFLLLGSAKLVTIDINHRAGQWHCHRA